MKKRNFLITSIISSLLLTSSISAQSMTCKNDKCYIDISKLSPSKNIASKVTLFKTIRESNQVETIVFDHSKYIMNENEKINHILNHSIMYNAEDIIVLEDSKYIMTETEKENFFSHINETELEVIIPIITIEDQISENIMLPNSELYCDNGKQATLHTDTNYYECV